MTTARLVPRSRCVKDGRIALKTLADRYQNLDEVGELGTTIGAILEEKCVSSQGAVQLMITVEGQSGEAQAASRRSRCLCGVAACPVSSGLTTRHRLNRGAGRAANSAIHIAAPGRLRTDDRTRA
ncbi:hypothetical protein [Atopobium sp. oral taxon 416]|uniref:hypothetical protein n=1 Tax=Atopobium sp. oral taxon 416 TaxID=712157 RepID=UPI001BA4EA36|nr:hypothetical protein [Atopobium sp. oral taxon 416]QUC03848.1 hypothetical protein J4859_02515 [Atopobium sp. oral taxon 416]